MHTLPIQIRFNDVDQMGHINNACIMEYFDLGKYQYFASAGVPCIPEEGDFCVMIVHFDVDFHSQIRFHDNPVVTSQVTRWGNKSFELTQQILIDGKPAATCRNIMAGYRRSTQSSATIPDEVKQSVIDYDATH
ncbi:MAG: acyl-CoA thioesterase [Bacteroidales bacterium]|nr:acyl-CoA thioesterase [Bacteroidales bacterium]